MQCLTQVLQLKNLMPCQVLFQNVQMLSSFQQDIFQPEKTLLKIEKLEYLGMNWLHE